MKSKKLLVIGGSGFFAKSILDHILDYNLFKNVKTVLLLSRGFNKSRKRRLVSLLSLE